MNIQKISMASELVNLSDHNKLQWYGINFLVDRLSYLSRACQDIDLDLQLSSWK